MRILWKLFLIFLVHYAAFASNVILTTRQIFKPVTVNNKFRSFENIALRGGNSINIPVEHKPEIDPNVIRLWENADPDRRKFLACFSNELDEWLRKERGISISNANRTTLLECVDHLSQRRQRTDLYLNSSFAATTAASTGSPAAAPERTLSTDELNERMWLACQLGDEDIVCQAVSDGAEVTSRPCFCWNCANRLPRRRPTCSCSAQRRRRRRRRRRCAGERDRPVRVGRGPLRGTVRPAVREAGAPPASPLAFFARAAR